MNNLRKNFLYNFLYNIVNLIIPLVTAPYVSRIIGSYGIGINSYVFSISQYFTLFAMLGLNNYGSRCIAKVRDDKKELSKNFTSIYVFQFLCSILIVMVYLLFVLLLSKNYKVLFLINILYVLSTVFDINWFFFGVENFKVTVSRNIIIKVLSTISVFIFVKSYNDLYIYALIISVSSLLSNIILWPFLLKKVKFVKVKLLDIKKHIKPNFTLFIPVIAVSIYNIMDKIMLGILSTKTQVGLYENSEKIVNVPVILISAIGTIMLPRISNLVSKKELNKVTEYLKKSIIFSGFLSFPIFFGILSVSNIFIPLYLGNEFKSASILVNILAIIIVFKSLALVIRTHYLIPFEEDKKYIISIILGACSNFIINLLLISKLNGVGACVGTVVAEFIVFFYQLYFMSKKINLKEVYKSILSFLFKSLIMFVFVYLVNFLEFSDLLKSVIKIILGVSVYGILNINYIKSVLKFKKRKLDEV